MARKQESYFWTSYSDLMTSLFFVMLVLFVLASTMLNNKIDEVEKQKEVSKKQLEMVKQIEKSIEAIDPEFFEYNPVHKKHILKINVQFQKGSDNINDIPQSQQNELVRAGRSIQKFLKGSYANVRYLLVIEGQSSKDDYMLNDELSFNRANSLKRFWKRNGISFDDKCEVIVSGSGQEGLLRNKDDEAKNQRFLIHIIPKPGVIDLIGIEEDSVSGAKKQK